VCVVWQEWIDWVQNHAEVPVLTSCLYLGFVFYVPDLLKVRIDAMPIPLLKAQRPQVPPAPVAYFGTGSGLIRTCVAKGRAPLRLRAAFAAWNLMLSVFSVIGTAHTLPTLLRHLSARGFRYSVCADPKEWYLDGPVGLWVGLFIFSKIPELLDTAFLVLQQKRARAPRRRPRACVLACGARACLRDVPAQQVIFLHWFHHATVMLYCWHAYHNRVAPGLWFAAMNFLVHSIMCHNPQPAPRGAAPGARAQRSGRHGAGSRRLKRGAVAGTCITARWRAG